MGSVKSTFAVAIGGPLATFLRGISSELSEVVSKLCSVLLQYPDWVLLDTSAVAFRGRFRRGGGGMGSSSSLEEEDELEEEDWASIAVSSTWSEGVY